MELIVRQGDREETLHVERDPTGVYRIRLAGREYAVDVAELPGEARSLLVDGRQYELTARRDGEGRYRVDGLGPMAPVEVMDPLTHLARTASGEKPGGSGSVLAMMPGRVVKILAAEGDEVVFGQGIMVLEAMKMENEIQAETAGVLQTLHVREGQAVEGGDRLFEVG